MPCGQNCWSFLSQDHTFEPVTRIRFFTLGQSVRYLFEHSFDHLNYLTRLDLSKVILDQLYPSSKCILVRYLQKQQRTNPGMIIIPPQAEFCDCVYDFILHLLKKKPETSYTELCHHNQQERCQLSECEVVKHFRLPSYEKKVQRPAVASVDESFIDLPISFYPVDETTTTATTTTRKIPRRRPSSNPRRPPVYPLAPSRDDNDDLNGSSFADTQVIIIQPIQSSSSSSSSPRPYFVVRKRTRKGKKQNRNQFEQTNPSYTYQGPHWWSFCLSPCCVLPASYLNLSLCSQTYPCAPTYFDIK